MSEDIRPKSSAGGTGSSAVACTQSRQPQNGASCKNDEAKRESASQCICIRKLLPLWFSLCIYLYTTSLSFFISLFFSFFLSVGSSLQLSGTGHPASLRLSFSLALRNLRWIIARARLARSVYTVVYILPGFAQVIYIYIYTLVCIYRSRLVTRQLSLPLYEPATRCSSPSGAS